MLNKRFFFLGTVREILVLTTFLKRERGVSKGKHTHCFTLQKCILSFVQINQIPLTICGSKSFANCLATPHLVSSLPTHLSAIRTTYNSFLSNRVVTNKSPQSENKCVQSGDTLPFSSFPMAGTHLAPSITLSRWWPLLCSCFSDSLPRHQVPVFR